MIEIRSGVLCPVQLKVLWPTGQRSAAKSSVDCRDGRIGQAVLGWSMSWIHFAGAFDVQPDCSLGNVRTRLRSSRCPMGPSETLDGSGLEFPNRNAPHAVRRPTPFWRPNLNSASLRNCDPACRYYRAYRRLQTLNVLLSQSVAISICPSITVAFQPSSLWPSPVLELVCAGRRLIQQQNGEPFNQTLFEAFSGRFCSYSHETEPSATLSYI